MEGNEAAAWARSKYRLTQQRKRGRGGRGGGGRGGGRSGPGADAALDNLDSNYDRYAEDEGNDVAAEDGAAPRLSQGADLEKLLSDTESLYAQAWYRHRSHLGALGTESDDTLPAVDVAAAEAALSFDLEALAASLAALPAAELLGVPEEYIEELQLEGLGQDRQQQQRQQQQQQHAQSLPSLPQQAVNQQQQQQQRSAPALLPWERQRVSSAGATADTASAARSAAAESTTAKQPAARVQPPRQPQVVDAAKPWAPAAASAGTSNASSRPVTVALSRAAASAPSTSAAKCPDADDDLDSLLSQARAGSSVKPAVAAGPFRPTPASGTRQAPTQQRSSKLPAAAARSPDDSVIAPLGATARSSTVSSKGGLHPASARQAASTEPGGSERGPGQPKGNVAPKPNLDDWLDSL